MLGIPLNENENDTFCNCLLLYLLYFFIVANREPIGEGKQDMILEGVNLNTKRLCVLGNHNSFENQTQLSSQSLLKEMLKNLNESSSYRPIVYSFLFIYYQNVSETWLSMAPSTMAQNKSKESSPLIVKPRKVLNLNNDDRNDKKYQQHTIKLQQSNIKQLLAKKQSKMPVDAKTKFATALSSLQASPKMSKQQSNLYFIYNKQQPTNVNSVNQQDQVQQNTMLARKKQEVHSPKQQQQTIQSVRLKEQSRNNDSDFQRFLQSHQQLKTFNQLSKQVQYNSRSRSTENIKSAQLLSFLNQLNLNKKLNNTLVKSKPKPPPPTQQVQSYQGHRKSQTQYTESSFSPQIVSKSSAILQSAKKLSRLIASDQINKQITQREKKMSMIYSQPSISININQLNMNNLNIQPQQQQQLKVDKKISSSLHGSLHKKNIIKTLENYYTSNYYHNNNNTNNTKAFQSLHQSDRVLIFPINIYYQPALQNYIKKSRTAIKK